MYEQGMGGLEKSIDKAMTFYERACEKGEGKACHNLAVSYARGDGVSKDAAKAEEYYRAGCQAEEMQSCFNLAVMLNETGKPATQREAMTLFNKACEGGDATGCLNAGLLMRSPPGGKMSAKPAEAANLFQKACDADLAAGCLELGRQAATGTGVDQDLQRAAMLFQKACQRDSASACAFLAGLHAEGRGVNKDDQRAMDLYRRACEGGEPAGCFNLGVFYESGRADTSGESGDRAAKYFNKACDMGMKRACAR
jgi:TPR repeat protein